MRNGSTCVVSPPRHSSPTLASRSHFLAWEHKRRELHFPRPTNLFSGGRMHLAPALINDCGRLSSAYVRVDYPIPFVVWFTAFFEGLKFSCSLLLLCPPLFSSIPNRPRSTSLLGLLHFLSFAVPPSHHTTTLSHHALHFLTGIPRVQSLS